MHPDSSSTPFNRDDDPAHPPSLDAATLDALTLDALTYGTPLSTLAPKPLTWLWPGLIPSGALTLLDGDPGVGTSLFTLTLAASVSSGSPLPDQARTTLPQGTVLLFAPHDDLATSILPRLSAAGADLSCIILSSILLDQIITSPPRATPTVITRPFTLPSDLATLERLIQTHHASLVILDHLSALMPPAPLHPRSRVPSIPRSLDLRDLPTAQDWRTAPDLFSALARIASASNCAILLVRHTAQGRSSGERYGTAPVHLALLPDPRAQDQRLLCTVKNTLSVPAPNHTYQITSSDPASRASNADLTHPTAPASPTAPLSSAAHTALPIPHLVWLASNPALTPALYQAAFSSLSPNRQTILRTLEQAPGPLGPQDLAAQTGLSYDLARRLLARMAEAKEIARYAYGIYTSLDHPCLAARPPLPKYSLSTPTSPNNAAPPTPSVTLSPAVPPASGPPIELLSPSEATPSVEHAPTLTKEQSSPSQSTPPVSNALDYPVPPVSDPADESPHPPDTPR